MRDLSTSEKFLYVVKRVLTSPLSLLLWAAGGALWWWSHSPWFMVAAAAAQLGLIYTYLHNEEYLRKLFLARQQREETLNEQQIEALLEQMDFETRQRIRYIVQLHKEMLREAREEHVESFTRKNLERIVTQLAPWVQQAVHWAMEKQRLVRALHPFNERAQKNYCNNLRQRIETTTDPVAKAQYEQALKAREAEWQAYNAMAQACGRIDSKLENIEATFASAKAKLIHIKTADAASAANVSEGLNQELELLSSDIDVLDKSISQALAADEGQDTQQAGLR